MTKHRVMALFRMLLVSGFLLLFLASCRQFFTTSLGSWAARDEASLIPTVTTDNVDELVEQSANNPDMSLALLEEIDEAVTDAEATDAAALQAAALDAAANASGVATAVLENAGTLLDTLDAGDDIIPVISDAIADLSNLSDTAGLLETILPNPDTDSEAFDAFVAEATPEDLAMAAIVLLAAEAQASDEEMEIYIDDFDPEAADLSPSEALAVALAEEAAALYIESGGTGDLADILEELNLITP